MRAVLAGAAAIALVACSGGGSTTREDDPSATSARSASTAEPTGTSVQTDPTTDPTTEPPTEPGASPAVAGFMAGAASRSVLPTVDGERAYLAEAPGWEELDADDPGVFVPQWDQGRVDVGNGSEDGSWVHDDLRTSALALSNGSELLVMASVDVYMIFASDAAEIERRARELLPPELADGARIIISATHNHHGPDSAFSVNDDWYALMADETAAAIAEAVAALEPAQLSAATGEHYFGMTDGRDPLVIDPRVNVLRVQSAAADRAIATVVQWTSHPETTLNWAPPVDLTEACAMKGWTDDDCSAEGRYFTADYPGALRTRLQSQVGGEVIYLNGAVGSQIGPGGADVWATEDDAAFDGPSVAPAGAVPVSGAADFRDRNFARTEAIGTELAKRVAELLETAADAPALESTIAWDEQPFYTRLTNIGFRVLLADGDLGWQVPPAYTCTGRPFTDANCVDDGGAFVDDPLLTPLIESQIRAGDVLETRLVFVNVGGVGFLFMPGELPPELVIGLPDDFATNTAAYYEEPELHAVGDAYVIPGALLDLVPTELTFTIGLGGDELGYWVPVEEVRLKCLDLVMPAVGGYTCQRLFDEGHLVTPDAVSGPVCRGLSDPSPGEAMPEGAARDALMAVCRYGQALGRELGEPDGHYEETNSAGWDLVDDTWAAAEELFSR